MKKQLLLIYFWASLLCTTLCSTENTEAIFTNIYDQNLWGNKESVSGPGSTLKETAKIRKEIPALFSSFNITSILDAPCGDFNWLKEVDLSAITHYTGVDIVADIINTNNNLYSDSTKSFFHKDILTDLLPTADLIMCRDCIVHFPFKEINKAIANFKKTGARYLLTTTFPGCKENKDIPALGGWRPLNLELPPFNFPKPLVLITEEIKYNNAVYVTKSLGLWKLEDIQPAKRTQSVTDQITPPFNQAMTCHTQDVTAYNKLTKKGHPAQSIFTFLEKQYDSYIRNNLEYAETERIPKIIHQIWIGTKPFPAHCTKWKDSWLQLNPDWEYKLWTNEDAQSFNLVNQKYFDEETNWGAKSDIFRYEILERFGGVYVDVDFECIQPFDWLHHCCDFYAGLLEVKRLKNTARLANGIIACTPHHPLMQKLVAEIPKYRNEKELLKRVGPDFFTDVIHKNIKNCPGINIMFPSNYFFSWSQNKVLLQPETMAIHYYAGTWH